MIVILIMEFTAWRIACARTLFDWDRNPFVHLRLHHGEAGYLWEYSWAYAAGSKVKVTGLADHLFKIFVNMEFIHVCSVGSRVLEIYAELRRDSAHVPTTWRSSYFSFVLWWKLNG